jgi:hypothetical protein
VRNFPFQEGSLFANFPKAVHHNFQH